MKVLKKSSSEHEPGHDLRLEHEDRTIAFLHRIIRGAVKVLAVLMVLVIVWGIGDVIYVLYQRLTEPPYMLLKINDILATFGAFLAVLIAIEIFINITIYLRDDEIHVKVVMATALVAIARKVIVLDFNAISATEAGAIAAIMLATSIGYWLVLKNQSKRKDQAP